MKVLVLPKLEETGTGLSAVLPYDNPDFERGLNLMFAITDKERIDQVEITKECIVARIVQK